MQLDNLFARRFVQVTILELSYSDGLGRGRNDGSASSAQARGPHERQGDDLACTMRAR